MGAIDLVRTLDIAGIETVVVAGRRNPARYTRAAVAVLEAVDPSLNPDAAVEALLAFAAQQPQRPTLFYDNDGDLMLISRERRRLEHGFRFVMPAETLVEDLVDKGRFQGLAERLQLPVPRGARMSSHDLGGDHGLRYPVIVKPLERHQSPWESLESAKALHIAGSEDLTRLQRRLEESEMELLIQEAIPGPEHLIESYHVYVDTRGAIAGEFTGRKLRTHPRVYGYSTAITITDSDEVKTLGRQIVAALELRGVAKLDFKRAPDGTLKLLEVNPRFNLWHHPGAVAGTNLPALVYADLIGRPRPPLRPIREGVTWCSAHDVQAASHEHIGVARWLRWLAACDVISGFSWNDPLPVPRAGIFRLRHRVASRLRTQRTHEPTAETGAAAPNRTV
jgi:predicted ATP-grasp superfamily ATP-dependent carboligase